MSSPDPERPNLASPASPEPQRLKIRPSADSNDSPPAAAASKSREISRRQFGRDAAIATAASLSVPVLIAAEASARTRGAAGAPAGTAPDQEEPATGGKPPTPSASQAKAPEPLKGLSAKQVGDIEAKLANILRKHPNRFSAEQKRHLRRILAQQERLLAPVRAFKVENGDPPASVLRVEFSDVTLPPAKKESD